LSEGPGRLTITPAKLVQGQPVLPAFLFLPSRELSRNSPPFVVSSPEWRAPEPAAAAV
jgi:hypothetical protein